MLLSDIKKFIETVGENASICLWCDNAINFYGKQRNGHIILDETNELIHYFANCGNTMEKSVPEGTQACEYILTHPEMVQYCRANLTEKEAKVVLAKLKESGVLSEGTFTEIVNDGIVFGRREHAESIPKEKIVKL